MNTRNEWMTDNEHFGSEYPNNMLLEKTIERFEIQKNSLEGKDAVIDGVSERVVSQNHTNPLNQSKYDLKIHCDMSSLVHTGSIIEMENKTWLVTSNVFDTQAYKTVSVVKSNNTLTFYSSQILYTLPCIFSDISIDMEESKFMNLPIGHYLIYISSGYITKSDLNLRFILNDSAYKIEGISNATNGLVKIELVDDEITPDDNLELGIANYYSNQIQYEVTILNGEFASLLYTNSTLQLNVQCKENGAIVSNPLVVYTTNNNLIATVSNAGLVTVIGTGDCIITATYNGITDTMNIHGDISSSNNYSLTLTPTDTTLNLGGTLKFTAHAFNNGIEDLTRQFNFIVSNLDGTTNKYVTVISDFNICTLNASISSSLAMNKYIKVRAELTYDSAIFVEKQIKIIGLI